MFTITFVWTNGHVHRYSLEATDMDAAWERAMQTSRLREWSGCSSVVVEAGVAL